jgi:predicted 3-demethylubiquinone-9 3-methyltransferase (glyoxalase superfamily)
MALSSGNEAARGVLSFSAAPLLTQPSQRGRDVPVDSWLDGKLKEAVTFYTTVFSNTRVKNLSPMSATFVIEGQEFMALNGGPQFKFNEAVSFFIRCETQAEVDDLWHKLTDDGGIEGRCGWLKDKFGLSWQVIPDALGRYLGDQDRAKAGRVMQAMTAMTKIDIAALEKAYVG